MAGYSTPYPPDWKAQRRMMREQARMQRRALRAQHSLYRERMRAMRGGSILGPLVLITIGVVFLRIETGHLQALRFWTWYGHWWPLLLVGGGLLVLAEWAIDRALASKDRPMVGRSFGFGLGFLFFLVVLTGLAASHGDFVPAGANEFAFNFKNDAFAEFFGNLHEVDQPFTETLPAHANLSIESPRGSVSVSGASTDGQMHIQLHREIYTNSDSDAQQKAQQLVPHLETSGSQVTLSLPFVQGTETSMTITVPPATPLSIDTTRGGIDVNAVQGALTLSSEHGDINVNAITGPVTAHLPNADSSFAAHNVVGAVRLESHGHNITATDITGSVILAGGGSGSAHLERISGPISYHSDRTQFDAARLDGQFDTNGRYLTVDQALGPVTLVTYSYDITLDRISGDTTVNNRNGSVDVVSAPPLGNVSIENNNGAVSLTVPEHSGFTVEATTTNAYINSDFLQPQRDNRQTQHLDGTVGSGGPLVRITTSHGDISLRKADIQALPATPPAPRPASAVATSSYTESYTDNGARDQVRQALVDARQSVLQAREDAQQARRDAQQAAREARQSIRDDAR